MCVRCLMQRAVFDIFKTCLQVQGHEAAGGWDLWERLEGHQSPDKRRGEAWQQSDSLPRPGNPCGACHGQRAALVHELALMPHSDMPRPAAAWLLAARGTLACHQADAGAAALRHAATRERRSCQQAVGRHTEDANAAPQDCLSPKSTSVCSCQAGPLRAAGTKCLLCNAPLQGSHVHPGGSHGDPNATAQASSTRGANTVCLKQAIGCDMLHIQRWGTSAAAKAIKMMTEVPSSAARSRDNTTTC